jgi:L-amino acid N-acyltransferase YncA
MRFNDYGVVGEIDSLPGCSQVAVFHSVFNPTERQKGRGKIAHQARLDKARYLGYNLAVCTVDLNNVAQLKILESFGWKQAEIFCSSKTGHRVGLFTKEI